MAEGQARGGEGAEAEAPHVDGSAARDAVDQLGHVVGEALDRHRPAGVGSVAVALELDPDDPAALRQPREDVAEAALERDDAAVEGDERRAVGVAVLLVPDGDAVDRSRGACPYDVSGGPDSSVGCRMKARHQAAMPAAMPDAMSRTKKLVVAETCMMGMTPTRAMGRADRLTMSFGWGWSLKKYEDNKPW